MNCTLRQPPIYHTIVNCTLRQHLHVHVLTCIYIIVNCTLRHPPIHHTIVTCTLRQHLRDIIVNCTLHQPSIPYHCTYIQTAIYAQCICIYNIHTIVNCTLRQHLELYTPTAIYTIPLYIQTQPSTYN